MNNIEYVQFYNKMINDNIIRKYQVENGTITRYNGDDRYAVKITGKGYAIPNVKAPPGVKYRVGDNVLVQFPFGNKQLPRIIGFSDLSAGVEVIHNFEEPDECCGGCCFCFLPGTLIDTIHGKCTIENITDKMYVFGYNETTKKIVVNKVIKILIHDKPYELIDKYLIVTTKHSKVMTTHNHPFYAGNGKYDNIENFSIGQNIYLYKFNDIIKEKIISKEEVIITDKNKRLITYNLELNGTNNYYANNYLVHNDVGVK